MKVKYIKIKRLTDKNYPQELYPLLKINPGDCYHITCIHPHFTQKECEIFGFTLLIVLKNLEKGN